MYTHAAAQLQRQFLKLHTSALQSLAVAGYQTACACGCPAAVSGSQTASLSKGRANIRPQKDIYQRIYILSLYPRLWKDHLKNDLRSDQDHRQKIDLRSRSRSRF
jgi:hypothetical protein